MRAYLDGHLLEQSSGAGWTQVPGTAPHVRVLEIDRRVAESLFTKSAIMGSTLVLDATDEGLGRREIKKLTITKLGPTANPHTAAVTVEDLRWTWRYPEFRRSYNVRKRTGERRRLPGGALAVAPIKDDEAYATWSLKDEKQAWTGADALEDVLNTVAPGWTREGQAGKALPDVEGVELVGMKHDAALGYLLAYFGLALTVRVDDDGTVVLYDRLDGKERELVGAPSTSGGTRERRKPNAAPELVGPPLWQVLDRRRERPSKIRVRFARALELRVDVKETAAGTDDQGSQVRGKLPPPRADNVVQLPEDAVIDGSSCVIGTYAKLLGYLRYLDGKQLGGLPPLTPAVLRDGFLSPVVFAYGSPALDPSGLWAVRASVIHGAYRVLFKIRDEWLSRIRNIRPYRVALLDPETGARGPAQVFADHARWITWRWLDARRGSDPAKLHEIVSNVYANPNATAGGSIIGTALESLRPAPALVSIEDEDQGVFRLDFLTDYTREVSQLLPSALDPATVPTHDPRERALTLQYARMTPTHEVSVVVTVAMGAPNDMRQFHTEEVTPEQAKAVLPATVELGSCEGPVMDVTIASSLEVARFAWQDDKADLVRQAFAAGSTVDLTQALGDPINKEQVRDVALAAAARVYAGLFDRPEGAQTTAFRADVKLQGLAAAVSHEWEPGPSGGAVTKIDLPASPPPLGMAALLPAGTRRIVERMVDP